MENRVEQVKFLFLTVIVNHGYLLDGKICFQVKPQGSQ